MLYLYVLRFFCVFLSSCSCLLNVFPSGCCIFLIADVSAFQ